EIQLIEQLEPRKVLLGDNARGHVVRVELGALEQMQQQVERPLVNGQPKTDRRVGLDPAWRGAVAHSSTRAIALIIGLITFSTESVYSSTSRIRKPNGSRRAYA